MSMNSDPRGNGGGDDKDVNDFPDIPTNDKGQATQYPNSSNDYPDFNTNDWGHQKRLPDFSNNDDD